MTKLVYAIESLSIWVGRAFGWCILILTLCVTYEVLMRYGGPQLESMGLDEKFGIKLRPTVWAFDMMIQMYGALFLMAGAYALAQDTHVRGDVLYRLFPVRVQAFIDFILYLLFFFPGVMALCWFGTEIAQDSWRYKEVSWNSPARIQIYFFKTLIPLAGFLLLLQGFAELIRAWKAMRTGVWMPRLDDVKETEDALIDDPALLKPDA